ncbi:MAG: extracellular matrix regulator RemB [Candidatus Onthomonas sp.]
MYLHLGQSTVIRAQDIIGIFDLEITSQSYRTRQYLNRAEKAGELVYTNVNEIPKSFVVCAAPKGREQTVYAATLNSRTLAKRTENSQMMTE